MCIYLNIYIYIYIAKLAIIHFLTYLSKHQNNQSSILTLCIFLYYVLGLCNSNRINKLLVKYKQTLTNCDVCRDGTRQFAKRMNAISKNDALDKGLMMCGQYMSSYSDACKLTLLQNFDDMYG